MPVFKRLTATIAAFCLFSASLPLPAQAGMVGTDEVISATQGVQERVNDLLARQDVRDALAARGVDPAEVQARVRALTDDEARMLAQRIDEMPAGGNVIGVLFAIFVILLITDILGLTKVFPFTRPIR
jgi:hypothetical protein